MSIFRLISINNLLPHSIKEVLVTLVKTLCTFTLCVFTLLGIGLGGAPAQSQKQTWPSKPIKLIVGFPLGGGIDMVARLLQIPLQEALGQQVMIDYKPLVLAAYWQPQS